MADRTACASRTTSRPKTRTVPASGLMRVATHRTNVVLPAPLGPRMARITPCSAKSSSSSSATVVPNRLTTPVASIIGVMPFSPLRSPCDIAFLYGADLEPAAMLFAHRCGPSSGARDQAFQDEPDSFRASSACPLRPIQAGGGGVTTFHRFPSGSLKYPKYPPHSAVPADLTISAPALVAPLRTSSTSSADGTM